MHRSPSGRLAVTALLPLLYACERKKPAADLFPIPAETQNIGQIAPAAPAVQNPVPGNEAGNADIAANTSAPPPNTPSQSGQPEQSNHPSSQSDSKEIWFPPQEPPPYVPPPPLPELVKRPFTPAEQKRVDELKKMAKSTIGWTTGRYSLFPNARGARSDRLRAVFKQLTTDDLPLLVQMIFRNTFARNTHERTAIQFLIAMYGEHGLKEFNKIFVTMPDDGYPFISDSSDIKGLVRSKPWERGDD